MGRENQPKERQRRELERKQKQRAKCDRILIVSEGSKTEPQYFDEIRIDQRLPAANITVSPGELGTEPIQVVKYARQLFVGGDKHRGIEPRAFERVYVVFDRDDHKTYFDALALASNVNGTLKNDAKRPVIFEAVVSVPSFELWLLLHYEDIQAPIHRDEVMSRLRVHIPGYEKGVGNIFPTTCEHIDIATQRAKALAAKFNAYSDPEPYTDIATLVQFLTALRV